LTEAVDSEASASEPAVSVIVAEETTKSRAFTLTQTVIIDRPVAAVFAYRCALANSPDWHRGVVTARLTPPGPIWVGSHCTETRSRGDDTEVWEIDVTDYEPNNLLGMVCRSGGLEVKESHQFSADGLNTRYVATADVTGSSLSGSAFQKVLLETLLQLKWAVEGVPSVGSALARRRFH